MSDLAMRKCVSCEGGIPKLSPEAALTLLAEVAGWEMRDDTLIRTFRFDNYFQTMAFVNAVAWIAHQEDHHPDLSVQYDRCQVRYTTHAVRGLTDNDFICAAKVSRLLDS